jgi:SsrA-binding protein
MAKPTEKASGDRTVATNRRARFDFELGDSYEAGMVLIGSEVRALREHGGDLADAWVDIDQGGEAWVKGMRIPPLRNAAFGHEEKRPRKLLLHREQIDRLRGAVERDGMTLIATRCHFKGNRAKLDLALARGRKKHDKRQAIRSRDAEREARASMARERRR